MVRFILVRAFQALVTLWAIVTMLFLLNQAMPFDSFGGERQMSEETRTALRAYHGLDQPWYVQYGRLWKNLGQFDLGPTMRKPGTTVNEIVADKFPTSIQLGSISLVIALLVGIPIGVLAAARKNTWADYLPMGIAMIGICLPTFVLGPLFSYLFGLKLNWFKVAGWGGPTDWVLPATTLGLFYAAYIARIVRGGMLEVLGQDYIRTARAKGVGTMRILFRHALRGGLLPLVSYLGPAIAGLVAGSFIIEKIFRVPGLGTEFIRSALAYDFPVVLGTALLFGALIISLNFIVDIAQALLDPRQRLSSS